MKIFSAESMIQDTAESKLVLIGQNFRKNRFIWIFQDLPKDLFTRQPRAYLCFGRRYCKEVMPMTVGHHRT